MLSSPDLRNVDVKGFPAPSEGFVLTHLLIAAEQDRSREFYRTVLGAEVIRERDPVVLRVGSSSMPAAVRRTTSRMSSRRRCKAHTC